MTSAAIQTAWAALAVGTLVDAGIRELVLSPGSRSTPLALAAAATPGLRLRVVIDERAAGFFALGAARALGRPVALACTSGTAVAHYAPAVIEAAHAGLPLVVLSADRPPELHGAGASQTIDQQRLFGGFVRSFVDVGAPDGSALALRALRRKLVAAVATARGPAPGPVHINVPLRKPLEAAAPTTEADHAAVAEVATLRSRPVAMAAPPTARLADAAIADAAALIAAHPRGVILATAAAPTRAALRGPIAALAARAGYPILAEAGSQLRFAPAPTAAVRIDHVPLLAAARPDLAPTLVLQLGGEPVAMAWSGFAGAAARIVLGEFGWPDGDSAAERVLVGDVGDAVARLTDALAPRTNDWAARWRAADAEAAAAVAAARTWPGPWSESDLLARVVAGLPDGAQLAIGNSLPIRVVDEVATSTADLAVLTQRGAAGIDGLIAGAAGAAWATGRPTTVVLGDVSFAHDVGGLATIGDLPVTVVVVDNRGGHIFDELPVARAGVEPATYRALWLTPPGLDPSVIAAGFGLPAQVVRNPDELLDGAGPRVIHAIVADGGAATTRAQALAHLAGPRAASHADAPGARP
jgi:2-succinyl-5-enolpyruvyl-6-hydroxy-3-cyclohexene-1-carboxylate synthase